MRVISNFNGDVDVATYGEDARIEVLPFPKISFVSFERKYKKLIKKRIGKLTKGMIKNQLVGSLLSFFVARRKGYKFVRKALHDSLKEHGLLHDN